MFAEFENSAELCSSKGFKYFSLSLPFPSIVFAFTGLHLAYHNKQIFTLDEHSGQWGSSHKISILKNHALKRWSGFEMSSPVLRNYDCNYKVYALLLVHSIGSFLSSIAALCLPIFGTYLCSEMGPVSALSYSDSADMQTVGMSAESSSPLIYLIHSFAGCLLFLLNMLSSVFGFFTLLKRSRPSATSRAGVSRPYPVSVPKPPPYSTYADEPPPPYESLQLSAYFPK
jgi:hypothetical protein